MKLLIPVVLVLLSLSSCTTFQYLTINSAELPYTGDRFSKVKDSLELGYQFSGYNAALQLVVKNNSSRPVTIDWKRSAVITNGITTSLFNPAVPIKASASYDTAQPSTALRSAFITGTALVPGETDFIPPFSSIQKQTINCIRQSTGITAGYNETIVKLSSLQQKIKLPGKTYSPENSPLTIRVYITYTAGNSESRVIEDSFFISEFFETTRAPETIRELFTSNGAVVYTF